MSAWAARWKGAVRAVPAILLAFGTGCSGAIEDGDARHGPRGEAAAATEEPSRAGASGEAASTEAGSENGADDVPPSVAAPDCDPVSPGRVTLQRLSRAEYNSI